MRDGLPIWTWWVIAALGAVITEYTLWLNVADALDRRREARAARASAAGTPGTACGHPKCTVCGPAPGPDGGS